ncbi:nitroreductase family protein [uncultured Selenomonas sp.]|uniref:nitroreductase family protein n=1 Tax=uncultured Selenomonas sp. TaxID=159275 RepID=UPI0025E0904E|nr:nitroreductase family protein [uncultured Selenomonas sp.]
MDPIFERVSIRKYEERPVEDDKIEKLLRAAMAAPSGVNQQPWEFYVVKNKEVITELSKASPFATCAAKAPVVIAAVMRKDVQVPEIAPYDMSNAIENILLEATTLGLGAVWLCIAPFEDRIDNVVDVLHTPHHTVPFALIPVGYPAEKREWKSRYDAEKVHVIE